MAAMCELIKLGRLYTYTLVLHGKIEEKDIQVMGNRRDVLKHSKAANCSTESTKTKEEDIKEETADAENKPEGTALHSHWILYNNIQHFICISVVYHERLVGGLTGWLASAEGNELETYMVKKTFIIQLMVNFLISGVGWMQFFVVTNAIILLLTTGLPRIWESIDFMTSSLSSE